MTQSRAGRARSGTFTGVAGAGSVLRRAALLLLLTHVGVVPDALRAQTPTVVGLVGGYTRTEQIWQPEAAVENVVGLVIGAFAHATTPLGWLSVVAEGTYTQRGGDVLDDGAGEPATGVIRSDYLTVSVLGRVSVGVGPVRFHAAAGPTIEQLIGSQLDATLAPVLERESSAVFSVTAGAGLGVLVSERYTVEVEARRVEGLGDAYSGGFRSVKNRSTELVARVGIPLPRR